LPANRQALSVERKGLCFNGLSSYDDSSAVVSSAYELPFYGAYVSFRLA
jgi:hypothetical protein